MPIQPIKIPQNVYIEDRIVGPLTLKQVLIVGIGAGFSYAIYGLMTKAYGALPLPLTIVAWAPAGVASIFAFIRINDISLFRLVLLGVERLNKPSTRIWTPRRGITINIRTFTTAVDEKKSTAAIKTGADETQLDELSVILDRSTKKKEAEDSEETDDAEERSMTTFPPSDSSDSSDSSESYSPRPVDPSRVAVSAPLNSIFRDISPHA